MPITAVPITTELVSDVLTAVPECTVVGDITVAALEAGEASCMTLTPVAGGATAVAQAKGDNTMVMGNFVNVLAKAAQLATLLVAAHPDAGCDTDPLNR